MSEYMNAVTYSALCDGCGRTQSILVRRDKATATSITRNCSNHADVRPVTLYRQG